MRLGRGLAIAAGVTAVAGFAMGMAVGSSADPEKIPVARKLPADFCSRLGDVGVFFPKTPTGTKLAQTGVGDVRCRADVDEKSQPTHTSAQLDITVTPYAAKTGSSAEQVARRAFDTKPWPPVKGRPYPTKIQRDQYDEEHFAFKAITVRGDVVVEVDYTAHPIDQKAAEQAMLVLADRAVWEAK